MPTKDFSTVEIEWDLYASKCRVSAWNVTGPTYWVSVGGSDRARLRDAVNKRIDQAGPNSVTLNVIGQRLDPNQ